MTGYVEIPTTAARCQPGDRWRGLNGKFVYVDRVLRHGPRCTEIVAHRGDQTISTIAFNTDPMQVERPT